MPQVTLPGLFLAGLFGSAHCLTMCGGLATALGAAPIGERRWRIVLSQVGRLLSYGALGAAAGALGMLAATQATAEHWSALLRVVTAALIVMIGLRLTLGASHKIGWLRWPERLGARVWRRAFPIAQRVLPRQPILRALLLGALWGWMPCGLIYSALMIAAAAGNASQGLLIMLAFGLGTLPAVLGVGHLGRWLPRHDGGHTRWLGALLIACGVWTAALPLAEMHSGGHVHHHHAIPAGMPFFKLRIMRI